MLTVLLSAVALVLIGVDCVLIWQFLVCLKKHRNEPVEAHMSYLIRRLNAILVNGFLVAGIRIALIFLR